MGYKQTGRAPVRAGAPRAPADGLVRCDWAARASELDIAYHDREWGVPVRDDQRLFEMLTLEGAQAGLSWTTILRKRDNYRRAFCEFDPERVARFDDSDVARLLADPGIVRHRLKVRGAIQNARVVLAIQAEFESFARYVWQFVGDRPRVNRWRQQREVPAKTPESVAMSKQLKRRGCTFVGPTICYAFMQAAGLVNDHIVSCFRYRQV